MNKNIENQTDSVEAVRLAGPIRSDGEIDPITAPKEISSAPISSGSADTSAAPIRSSRGRAAHFTGALVGALLGKLLGADRPERFANHYALDGVPFQIRTISGSQSTFTVNPETEPDRILVAAKRERHSTEDATAYAIFGVMKSDAVACGKKSGSRGHAKSGHLQVSLNVVKRAGLGRAVIKRELITAADQDERYERLAAIDAALPGEPLGVLDHLTVNNILVFLSGSAESEAAKG